MRQKILENHRWKFYRIWSTNWFQLRKDAIKKLENALKQAMEKASEAIKIDSANSGSIVEHEETHDMPPEPSHVTFNDEKLQVPAYKRAELQEETNLEPHEISRSRMGEIVGKIVTIEGPIHCEEVARRVASVRQALETQKHLQAVRDEQEHWKNIGVHGIPLFILNQEIFLQGAPVPPKNSNTTSLPSSITPHLTNLHHKKAKGSPCRFKITKNLPLP